MARIRGVVDLRIQGYGQPGHGRIHGRADGVGWRTEGRKSRAPLVGDVAITSLTTFRWIVAVATSTPESSSGARARSACGITSLAEGRRREERPGWRLHIPPPYAARSQTRPGARGSIEAVPRQLPSASGRAGR